MLSPSPSETARNLAEYLDYVEFWTPDCGDAFVMLNAREWLAQHHDTLSAAQRVELAGADDQVRALAAAAVGDSDDIQFLRLTAQAAVV